MLAFDAHTRSLDGSAKKKGSTGDDSLVEPFWCSLAPGQHMVTPVLSRSFIVKRALEATDPEVAANALNCFDPGGRVARLFPQTRERTMKLQSVWFCAESYSQSFRRAARSVARLLSYFFNFSRE